MTGRPRTGVRAVVAAVVALALPACGSTGAVDPSTLPSAGPTQLPPAPTPASPTPASPTPPAPTPPAPTPPAPTPVPSSPVTEPAPAPTAPALPPAPGPAQDLPVATQFGLGDVGPGTSVAEAERSLGVSYDDVALDDGDCQVLFDWDAGLGVIVSPPGTVQAHVVQDPGVRTAAGVHVGATWQDVAAAYPRWIGESSYRPDAGGRYALISPSAFGTRFDTSSRGRGMFFQVDAQDRVVEYRVGAMPYVHLINYCSMPD